MPHVSILAPTSTGACAGSGLFDLPLSGSATSGPTVPAQTALARAVFRRRRRRRSPTRPESGRCGRTSSRCRGRRRSRPAWQQARDPSMIRTCDPQFRKLVLYPAELWVQREGTLPAERGSFQPVTLPPPALPARLVPHDRSGVRPDSRRRCCACEHCATPATSGNGSCHRLRASSRYSASGLTPMSEATCRQRPRGGNELSLSVSQASTRSATVLSDSISA